MHLDDWGHDKSGGNGRTFQRARLSKVCKYKVGLRDSVHITPYAWWCKELSLHWEGGADLEREHRQCLREEDSLRWERRDIGGRDFCIRRRRLQGGLPFHYCLPEGWMGWRREGPRARKGYSVP